jgi:hypothetical protein
VEVKSVSNPYEPKPPQQVKRPVEPTPEQKKERAKAEQAPPPPKEQQAPKQKPVINAQGQTTGQYINTTA